MVMVVVATATATTTTAAAAMAAVAAHRDAAVSLNVDYFSMLEKRARKIQLRASTTHARDTQSDMTSMRIV